MQFDISQFEMFESLLFVNVHNHDKIIIQNKLIQSKQKILCRRAILVIYIDMAWKQSTLIVWSY